MTKTPLEALQELNRLKRLKDAGLPYSEEEKQQAWDDAFAIEEGFNDSITADKAPLYKTGSREFDTSKYTIVKDKVQLTVDDGWQPIESAQSGVDIEQCITDAYKTIRHRQGKMINGVFVRDV